VWSDGRRIAKRVDRIICDATPPGRGASCRWLNDQNALFCFHKESDGITIFDGCVRGNRNLRANLERGRKDDVGEQSTEILE